MSSGSPREESGGNCGSSSDCQSSAVPGGEHNLVGCMGFYGKGCVQKLPEEGHVLTPWVRITFSSGAEEITVGNESSPATTPQHVACIKSFSFGHSNGMTVKLTIHDEQGGSFVQFMDNLLKDWHCLYSPVAAQMRFRFGWAKGGCGTPIPEAISRCYYCHVLAIETNMADGKFMFEITGQDQVAKMFEGYSDGIWGGEGENGVPITEAITEMLTNTCAPNVKSVKFLTSEGGVCKPLEFEHGEKDDEGRLTKGPKGKWIASGKNKIEAAMEWLNKYRTKNLRGFKAQFNPETPGGEVIFWEDATPATTMGDEEWEKRCMGVYIVNGGKQSPVIEFNPKIRWDFSRLVNSGGALSGDTVNPFDTEGSKTPGSPVPSLDAENKKCAGQMTQTTGSDTQKDIFGKNAHKETQKGNAEAQRGNSVLPDPIEADLVVVGDPTMLPPSKAMFSKSVTIVVVNPFFLTQSTNQCGTWLANPVCNEVLSSKAWIPIAVTHKIENGSYTTTVQVKLLVFGIDLPDTAPLGGWLNGWKPPRIC